MTDEYRVVFVPWYALTGETSTEQTAIFTHLDQITAWVELCRAHNVRISVHSLEHCTVERTDWEPLLAEQAYLQTRTGQYGIPTQDNLKL